MCIRDREEAFTIADRVAIIRDGRIVADDSPENLWNQPPDGWTARFIGLENLLPAPTLSLLGLQPPSGAVTTGVIPPESIVLTPKGARTATVAGSHFRGGIYRVELGLHNGHQLVAWSPKRLHPESTARFDIDDTRVSWFID